MVQNKMPNLMGDSKTPPVYMVILVDANRALTILYYKKTGDIVLEIFVKNFYV